MKKIEFKPYALVHTDNVDIYEVHSLFIDEDEKSIDICDEWNMSMGKIYYEDCKTVECLTYDKNERLTGEIKTIIKNAKIYKGVDNMIEQIITIIRTYRDVELIDTPKPSKVMEFNLYDFLDKPANFEDDVECIIHEIQPVIPTTYTVSHKYCNDEYWNGEEMVESNLSCTITVEYKGDNQ